MRAGIAARNVVVELAFDVDGKSAGSDAEEVWIGPLVSELLLHQGQPRQCILGLANATGGLEANLKINEASTLMTANDKLGWQQILPCSQYAHDIRGWRGA